MKQRILWFVLMICASLASRAQIAQDSLKAPKIVNVFQPMDTVGLYDKFEARLNIACTFVNPFDPDEIDISADFTSPSGKHWKIFGYYDFSARTLWNLRFAPDELGTWRYVVHVKDINGEDTSESRSFVAVKSKYHGPLKIAANNRFLEYKDGTPFYGVGLWYNGRVTGENLDELKTKGVNFISNYITPLETRASGVGRYDQEVCSRIDNLIELCEEREMVVSLNLWFHAFLSETVWGGGNIRWQTNPYQNITTAKDFFRSEEAWTYQEKLYRYFIARWGYSRSLALWFIVDEVNGTDGWASGDSLVAADWLQRVHTYFKKNDPYNHPTTGTRSGGIREFWHEGYQITDIAGREIYEAQGFPMVKQGTLDSTLVHPLTYSYRNYAGQVTKIWNNYGKPVIIGETGWDHTYYEPPMPGYIAMHHNSLWVSLMSGACMSPFWWSFSGRLNDVIVTSQMKNLREFSDAIPFSKLSNVTHADIKIEGGDGFGMQSDQLTYGWVVNPNTDVAADTITVSSLKDGKYKLRIYLTWRGEFMKDREVIVQGGVLKFAVPYLLTTGSHANYVGQDVAFLLEPIPSPPPVKTERKKRG